MSGGCSKHGCQLAPGKRQISEMNWLGWAAGLDKKQIPSGLVLHSRMAGTHLPGSH